jgi:hypothetical protein
VEWGEYNIFCHIARRAIPAAAQTFARGISFDFGHIAGGIYVGLWRGRQLDESAAARARRANLCRDSDAVGHGRRRIVSHRHKSGAGQHHGDGPVGRHHFDRLRRRDLRATGRGGRDRRDFSLNFGGSGSVMH